MHVDACAALPGRTAHLFVEVTRHLTQAVAVAVDEGDQAAAFRGAAQELDVGSRQRRFQHLEAGKDVRVNPLNLSVDHVSERAGSSDRKACSFKSVRTERRTAHAPPLVWGLILENERLFRVQCSG